MKRIRLIGLGCLLLLMGLGMAFGTTIPHTYAADSGLNGCGDQPCIEPTPGPWVELGYPTPVNH